MIPLKYLDDSKNVEELTFPFSDETLRDIFPQYKIKLEENDHPVMKYFNHKEMNVYDVNAIINRLNYFSSFEENKLNAILEIYKPQTANAFFNVVKHLDHFVLVDNYAVFHNNLLLGHEILNQSHMHFEEKYSDDNAIKELAVISKQKLRNYTTSLGWLFEVKPIGIVQTSSEIYHDDVHKNTEVFNIRIWNRRTMKHAEATLPTQITSLTELLGRLECTGHNDTHIYVGPIEVDTNLFKQSKYMLNQVSLEELNEIADEFKYIENHHARQLAGAINITKPYEKSELFYLMDNINSFELIDINLNEPRSYAEFKLKELTNGYFNEIIDILDDFVSYEELGEYLMKKDNLVQTPHGVIRVDEKFDHFLDHTQELNHAIK